MARRDGEGFDRRRDEEGKRDRGRGRDGSPIVDLEGGREDGAADRNRWRSGRRGAGRDRASTGGRDDRVGRCAACLRENEGIYEIGGTGGGERSVAVCFCDRETVIRRDDREIAAGRGRHADHDACRIHREGVSNRTSGDSERGGGRSEDDRGGRGEIKGGGVGGRSKKAECQRGDKQKISFPSYLGTHILTLFTVPLRYTGL